MASINDFFDEKWSRRIQLWKKANSVAYSVSNLEEVENLSSGDRVHRPKAFDFVVNDYSRTADQNLQAIETDDQYIDINRQKQVSFYIDKLDETQSKYNLSGEAVDRAVYRIANEIDQTRFKETLNANYTADDGTIGGTPGNAISTVSANFYKLFPSVKGMMANARIETDRAWYAVLSPEMVAGIEITALEKGFQKADSTMEAGYKGNFGGFRIYESTNLAH